MIKKLINSVIGLFLVFLCNCSSSYIYKLSHFALPNHNIYFFYDFHKQIPGFDLAICKKQIKDIIDAAKQQKAFLIIEDNLIGSMEGMAALFKNPVDFNIALYPQHKSILDKLFQTENDLNTCPINGLGAYAYHEKIPYKVIEFRFAQRQSLEGRIKASLFIESIEKVAKEISLYNDNPILNAYYRDKALGPYNLALTQAKDFFDAFKVAQSSAKEILPNVAYKDSYDPILDHVYKIKIANGLNTENKKLFLITYYDSSLINARILHTIFENKNHNSIFVIAGGIHLNDIDPALEQLGYKQLKTIGVDYTKDELGRTIYSKPIDIGSFFH